MKVSIITPVYNAEKFIENTIDSIIKQTHTDWELLLVDDCSKDNSESIIRRYMEKDSRIKYIKLETNSGAAIARNTAIENSTGKYLAFLDSDDLWEPEKLELQIKFMKENNIGFTFTSYKVMNEAGECSGKIIHAPKQMDYNSLLKNTIIGCLTVMLDKDIVGDVRMPLIRTRQDLVTWLSILKKGHIAYGLDVPLARYRLVENSISSNKGKMIKQNWNVYRNIEKLSFMKSAWILFNYGFNAVKKRL